MVPVKIDIVSDIACPWCYVGRRRLGRALAQRPHVRAVLNWQPFELFPSLPAAGVERQAHLARLFGSATRRDAVLAQVAAAGRAEGLALNFGAMRVSPNTFPLHRLLWKARQLGHQDELAEALFRAFFTEARDLSQPDILRELLLPFGWSGPATAAFLGSDEGSREVLARRRHYQVMGVRSVPFYVLNDRVSVSGAQPPAVFAQAISEAVSAPAPEPATGAG